MVHFPTKLPISGRRDPNPPSPGTDSGTESSNGSHEDDVQLPRFSNAAHGLQTDSDHMEEHPSKRRKTNNDPLASSLDERNLGISHLLEFEEKVEVSHPTPSASSPSPAVVVSALPPAVGIEELVPALEVPEGQMPAPLAEIAGAPAGAAAPAAMVINWNPHVQVADAMGNAAWTVEPAPQAVQQVLETFVAALQDVPETSLQFRQVLGQGGLILLDNLSTVELARVGLERLQNPNFLENAAARHTFNETLNLYFDTIGRVALDHDGLAVLDHVANEIPMLAAAATDFQNSAGNGEFQSFGDLVLPLGDASAMDDVVDLLENEVDMLAARDALANIVGSVIVLLSPLPAVAQVAELD